MSRGNDIFQVLVSSGDQALLAAGNSVEDLAPGQLGVFTYPEGVSVAPATTNLKAVAKNFFIAVGVDKTGSATLEDINTSAGTHIQLRNVVAYSARCYTPSQPKIVELVDFTVDCDTEYGVKFEIRNQQAYRVHGYNQVVKTFMVKTEECDGCEDCPSGKCVDLAVDLAAEVNADDDGLILAELIVPTGTITVTGEPTTDEDLTITLGSEAAFTVAILDADDDAGVATKIAAGINGVSGTAYRASSSAEVVTIYGPTAADVTIDAGTTGATFTDTNLVETVVSDVAAFVAAVDADGSGEVEGSEICPGLRFTVQAEALKTYCEINLNYFYPRQTDIIVSKIEGFKSNGTISTTQEIVYEEGSGYDVRQLEYEAGGWNGKPGIYRTSEMRGVSRNGFEYYASSTGKYFMLHLGYDQASIAGFLEHKNNQRTILAIPATDDTTRDAIVALLDAMLDGQFAPLAAYTSACPGDGTTVNLSSAASDPFAQGIGTP